MVKKNSNLYKILAVTCSVVITTAIGYLIVWAGNLNPPSTPADTMYTLDDIYHRLDKDAGAPASWGLNPSAAPTGTMHTLEDVYNKTPDFRTNPGNASTSDVCNSATFYKDSATKLTGTRTACYNPRLPDTGQTSSYTTTYGEDHDYTSSNSTHTCDPSFTNNGDGTITDNCTGLMWKRCSEGMTYNVVTGACDGSATTYTWENALTQCEGLIFAGYSDWRLPNIKELMSIVDYQNYNPSINTTYFPANGNGNYWSATTYVYNTSYAWRVYFGYASVDGSNKTYGNYVRCVRG